MKLFSLFPEPLTHFACNQPVLLFWFAQGPSIFPLPSLRSYKCAIPLWTIQIDEEPK